MSNRKIWTMIEIKKTVKARLKRYVDNHRANEKICYIVSEIIEKWLDNQK